MTWRAVHCVMGRELAVRDALIEARIPAWCPWKRVDNRRPMTRGEASALRRASPGAKPHKFFVNETIKIASFPGYLFAESEEIEPLRMISGVIDALRRGVEPISIPQRFMNDWYAETDNGRVTNAQIRRWLGHDVGDEFVFKGNGPWAGFVGQITDLSRLDSHNEIRALVSLFGRRSEVSLDVSMVGRAISGSRIAAVVA